MTLRELGTVLWPFMPISVIDEPSMATLSDTTWQEICDDTTDLSPDVLNWQVTNIDAEGVDAFDIWINIYVKEVENDEHDC